MGKKRHVHSSKLTVLEAFTRCLLLVQDYYVLYLCLTPETGLFQPLLHFPNLPKNPDFLFIVPYFPQTQRRTPLKLTEPLRIICVFCLLVLLF